MGIGKILGDLFGEDDFYYVYGHENRVAAAKIANKKLDIWLKTRGRKVYGYEMPYNGFIFSEQLDAGDTHVGTIVDLEELKSVPKKKECAHYWSIPDRNGDTTCGECGMEGKVVASIDTLESK